MQRSFWGRMSRYLAHGRMMMWQPVYASGQMRFPGAGWGVCVSPTGGPQGQLQTSLVRDWDGDLSGSPRLVGAKQAASPRSQLLGAPPLTTMRASRAFRRFDCVSLDPEALVAFGPIGRVQSSLPCRASPAKPNSGFSASAQAWRNDLGPSKVLGSFL